MARPAITGDIIRRIELYCDAARSDKIYIITLTEEASGNFRVWFEHGPRGHVSSGGEKTNGAAVAEAQARSIFDRLVNEKTNKGYRVINDHSWTTATAGQPAPVPKPTPQRARNNGPKIPAIRLDADNRAVLNNIF
jgi:predicted DNA-binding WGR domain protein